MKSIERLVDRAGALSPEESAIFDRVIVEIEALIFNNNDLPEVRRKVLNGIERYLKKKNESITKENTSDKAEYLRFVRNSLAHKSHVPPEVIALAIPMFWAILLESAPWWNVRELSNLLAYAVRFRGDYPADKVATTTDVTRYYQTSFKKIPAAQRNEVFKEILLSIFVTPQFQDALLAYKHAAKKKRGDNFAN